MPARLEELKSCLLRKDVLYSPGGTRPPDEKMCTDCFTGACCREGAEVDLEEAVNISQLDIDIPKPWFEHLHEDKNYPSGWSVDTIIRNNTCVFQREDRLCAIYPQRPRMCAEFPFEAGKKAKYYDRLCPKAFERAS